MLRATSNAARVSLLVLAGLVLCAVAAAHRRPDRRPPVATARCTSAAIQNQILIIDEATEQVTGSIPVKVGIPRRVTLSQDLKRFYVISATSEDVEILDIATRQTVDQFRLSEGNKKVRISSIAADPLGRYVIMITKTIDQIAGSLRDRHRDVAAVRSEGTQDHADHPVAGRPGARAGEPAVLSRRKAPVFSGQRSLDLRNGELHAGRQMGHVERRGGTWPGRVNFGGFGGADTVNDEPGFFTTTMTVTDPIQHRQFMGIAKINLTAKTNEFYTIGPAGGVSFSLAADRKHGFGLESAIGRYQFWTFDLVNRRVTKRGEIEGRPRMAMKPSTNSQLLYVFQAGNTIDVYDAATYRYLRTITLAGDETSTLFVVPQRPANRP